MTDQFITNQDKLLSDVIGRIMPSCHNLDFLVGYFYFSGFKEIYRHLKNKHVRILVGLEIERDLAGKIQEFELIEEIAIPRGQARENYYQSLISLFNNTTFFDSREKQDAFQVFLAKLKDGTLEIRKTLQHNHAKLYIFENQPDHNQGGEFPGTIITGSSNLTRSGLAGRFEINVDFRDKAHFDEAKAIFARLWKDAVIIADPTYLEDFLHRVVEKVWIDKLPKPFLLYVRVLEEYFSHENLAAIRFPAELSDGEFLNLKYQTHAVAKALEILRRHNGVIIADVVGLGKSIIASAVARNLNIDTTVIAPPHLVPQWEEYRYTFGFNARVYSSGKIEQALQENKEAADGLVIIDEAHKYRNDLTFDYAALHQLCQRRKVILLTATPFNNAPQDIFALVKLFQIPTRSTLQTVQNLSYEFRRLITEYEAIRKSQRNKIDTQEIIHSRAQKVAGEIRNLLAPLVIRRSRLDLEAIDEYREDLKAQNIAFPKVNDPVTLDYDLGALSVLYEETLRLIAPENEEAGFIGARYMPISYLKDIQSFRKRISSDLGVDENLLKEVQVNLARFMRRLLVRRFESSMIAFQSTLSSMIESSERILDWYERLGKVPIYKKGSLPDVEELEEAIGEELDAEVRETVLEEQLHDYNEKGLLLIDKDELKQEYSKLVKKDIALLKSIRDRWFGKGVPQDPKLQRFTDILEQKLKEMPGRKVVVFSEFADTADYLYQSLKGKLKVFKYAASDASPANKRIIRENFDAGSTVQKDDYQVLIATDAISEGYNLHRAGIIFNYDIPYNPTRVIQRVGRINRINKKVFEELFIYNFFPTATGERETRIKQVSTLKMAMIHALFGEDTKILTSDEELQRWMVNQVTDKLHAQEELSPEAPYENFIRKLRMSEPELLRQCRQIPKRVRIRRSIAKDRQGALIFARKGKEFAFKWGTKKGDIASLTAADAFSLFEAEMSEDAQKPTDVFNELYERITPKLFSHRSEVEMDKGKADAIHKVRLLRDSAPSHKDYLADLLYVMEELDALPAKHSKLIRALASDTAGIEPSIVTLREQIPHDYLLGIVEREKTVEQGVEDLILAEEII